MLLSRELLLIWARRVAPAALKYARIIGTDTHFILSVQWGEQQLDFPLTYAVTANDVGPVGDTLAGMAGLLGAPLGESPSQYHMPYLAHPVQWDEWQRLQP